MSIGAAGARRALILSGGGDYTDPWHPFTETSEALGALVQAAGFEVDPAVQVDRELAALLPDPDAPPHPFAPVIAPQPVPDVIVLNAGRGDDPAPPSPAAQAGLLRYLAQGGGLVVLHAATMLWADWPEWERIIGGRWVSGVSWHPDFSAAEVLLRPEPHPVTTELASREPFTVYDERYSDLSRLEGNDEAAWHEYSGVRHPLVWTRHYGAARVVVDLLGHDLRSYGSAERRALLIGEVRWAAGDG
jgi:hypothetical protein